MEKYIRLVSCIAVVISSGLITASAFADSKPTVGILALLLSNLGCFIAGIILSDD